MLFNSPAFLFGFLPPVLLGFLLLRRFGRGRAALGLLTVASFGFYGWWDPRLLPLLLASVAANHWLAGRIIRAGDRRRRIAAAGVVANLMLLAVCKYGGFVAANLRAIGVPAGWDGMVLPIGISFFTFQQIAYLVDTARDQDAKAERFGPYALFIGFFPHLIAGPLTHHATMLGQFRTLGARRKDWREPGAGLGIFALALAKKVMLADGFGRIADPVFATAAHGGAVGMLTAWTGAAAYGLQLYFDFSAYSEMAIGLGLMFGIRLPVNFRSPYRATSIIDFWRRWHMTLSAFLRDYLYIPLGGSALGGARRMVNLMATMLLGGLWHGANWTFVVWGGLHGMYLVAAHLWRATGVPLPRALAGALTFMAVTVAWVFFRAPDLAAAGSLLGAMAGQGRGSMPEPLALLALAGGLALVWGAPGLLEVVGYDPDAARPAVRALPARRGWRPSVAWGATTGMAMALAIAHLPRAAVFLYFDF